ncbi:maltose O-acetyltransferase [Microbacterium testaceum]|uniref:acyltransferase n=1 Tax=Microbacterium testaceum TaxID=2033 RepID=UPI0027898980|nr:acyltransferase [Microbacterium testaceum]MDQ1174269.1 maltose O-acetyltransferase [Microbacterium testaceum]
MVIPQMRLRLLRASGLEIGSARIKSRVFFGSRNLKIGDGTFINVGSFFDGSARIEIGRGCSFGYGAMISTSGHSMGPSTARAGADSALPVVVGDGVWVGARAVILGGVSVGSGCVIAAGAVVIRDCAADGLYAGVPARRVRELGEDEGTGDGN